MSVFSDSNEDFLWPMGLSPSLSALPSSSSAPNVRISPNIDNPMAKTDDWRIDVRPWAESSLGMLSPTQAVIKNREKLLKPHQAIMASSANNNMSNKLGISKGQGPLEMEGTSKKNSSADIKESIYLNENYIRSSLRLLDAIEISSLASNKISDILDKDILDMFDQPPGIPIESQGLKSSLSDSELSAFVRELITVPETIVRHLVNDNPYQESVKNDLIEEFGYLLNQIPNENCTKSSTSNAFSVSELADISKHAIISKREKKDSTVENEKLKSLLEESVEDEVYYKKLLVASINVTENENDPNVIKEEHKDIGGYEQPKHAIEHLADIDHILNDSNSIARLNRGQSKTITSTSTTSWADIQTLDLGEFELLR